MSDAALTLPLDCPETMITLLDDRPMWDDLLRLAHREFYAHEDKLDEYRIVSEWKDTMTTHNGDWSGPPAFEHYNYDDLDEGDTLFQNRLMRGVLRFSSEGTAQFSRLRVDLGDDWKSHISTIVQLDQIYKRENPEQQVALPKGEPRWEARRIRTEKIRDWADRTLDLRSGGLDRLIHLGNDLAVQIAVSDAILKSFRRRDALPLLTVPHWLMPATEEDPVEPGLASQWPKTGQLRTAYEVVCAVADLHSEGDFAGRQTISSVSNGVQALKRRTKQSREQRGFSRSTLYGRLAHDLKSVFKAEVLDSKLDDLIPFIEQFEQEGRPEAGLSPPDEG